ncbi:MAG: lysophospholipase [Clostridia bacterium]|nr:lysophospholipase [Clostridia bacterium]
MKTKEIKRKYKYLYVLMFVSAGIIAAGFAVRLIADAVKYNPMSTSVPFSLIIVLRSAEYLVPAAALLAAGLILRARYIGRDELKRRSEERKARRKAVPRRVRLRRAAITAVSVVLAFFIISAVAPFIGLNIFLHRHIDYSGIENSRYPLQGVWKAEDFGLEAAALTLETADGEKVRCYEVGSDEPQAVVVFATGIEQPSVTYFFPQARIMHDENVASFLLEVRSHGESTGKKLGLGYTEVEDVRAVFEYIASVESYTDVPVILMGVSMGGAVVLNSFGEIPEADGVLAMSPYASFEFELDLMMERYHVPGFLRAYEMFFSKMVLSANYGKAIIDERKPESEIKKADGRPVAVIACGGDGSVPVENTVRIAEGCPEAKVWIRNSWEHFIIKNCDFRNVAEDAEYISFVFDFIDEVIASVG